MSDNERARGGIFTGLLLLLVPLIPLFFLSTLLSEWGEGRVIMALHRGMEERRGTDPFGILEMMKIVEERMMRMEEGEEDTLREAELSALIPQVGEGVRLIQELPLYSNSSLKGIAKGGAMGSGVGSVWISSLASTGFILEACRMYDDAGRVFEKVAGMEGLKPGMRSLSILHLSLCRLLAGDIPSSLSWLVEGVPGPFETGEGRLLLRARSLLEGLRKMGAARCVKGDSGSGMAGCLFHSLRYRELEDALSPRDIHLSKEVPEILYICGRFEENSGRMEEAIKDYLAVYFRKDATRELKKKGLMRLFMAGSLSGGGGRMAEFARKGLIEIGGGGFVEGIEPLIDEDRARILPIFLTAWKGRGDGFSLDSFTHLAGLLMEVRERVKAGETGDPFGFGSLLKGVKGEIEGGVPPLPGAGRSRMSGVEREGGGLTAGMVRSPESINSTIMNNIGSLKSVYEKYLKVSPSLQGKIVFEFSILASGRVSGVKILESSFRDRKMEGEMMREMRKWRFPSIKGDEVVFTRFPFVFSPSF